MANTPTPPRTPVVEIIHPKVVESLRKMTPAQRLEQAFGMWDLAVKIVRASIKRDHPDWTDEQIHGEAAKRLSHGATERVPR